MRIYLDLLFALNFFFDFLLLLTVALLLRRNIKFKCLVLGAFLGALSIFLLFIPLSNILLFIYKLIISLVMVIITFGYKNIRYVMRNLLFLYSTSMILGGFLYFLNIEFSYRHEGLIFFHQGLSINFIVLIILSPLIVYIYIKQGIALKNHYANCYQVDLYFKDGTVKKLNGFLDTGNKLYDPYQQRPIILVNPEELKADYNASEVIMVPYESINSCGLLKCVAPDKIHIIGVGERRQVLVGISKEKIKIEGVNCLLHSKLWEG